MPPLPVLFGSAGGTAGLFVEAAPGESWSAVLEAGTADWLSLDPPSGTGPAALKLTAPALVSNEPRLGCVTIRGEKTHCSREIRQAAAPGLAALSDSVLAVPFPAVPRTMEVAILTKFVAGEIAKVPEPFTLPVLAVAEALVPVVGELVIALRAAGDPIIPEPRTWFPPPTVYAPLIEVMPATALCIQQDTIATLAYLPIAFAEAEGGD